MARYTAAVTIEVARRDRAATYFDMYSFVGPTHTNLSPRDAAARRLLLPEAAWWRGFHHAG